MNRKSFLVGLLAAGCFVATSTLMTSPGNAQADPKVAKAMAILKAETAKLGAPKVEGTDQVPRNPARMEGTCLESAVDLLIPRLS